MYRKAAFEGDQSRYRMSALPGTPVSTFSNLATVPGQEPTAAPEADQVRNGVMPVAVVAGTLLDGGVHGFENTKHTRVSIAWTVSGSGRSPVTEPKETALGLRRQLFVRI